MRSILRFLYTLEVSRHAGRPLQAGALCWRRGEGGIEILLVTSRRSGKWGVPKGWTRRFRPLHETARREAWEEAGVVGSAENRLLGIVSRPKTYRWSGIIPWQLALYPLEVKELAEDWPERRLRHRRWFPITEAAEKIRPRRLAPLLTAFAAMPVPPPLPAAPPLPPRAPSS